MQCRIWKIILKVTGETQYSFGNDEYIVLTNDMDVTAVILLIYISVHSTTVLKMCILYLLILIDVS